VEPCKYAIIVLAAQQEDEQTSHNGVSVQKIPKLSTAQNHRKQVSFAGKKIIFGTRLSLKVYHKK
jgi:hypothetical protein